MPDFLNGQGLGLKEEEGFVGSESSNSWEGVAMQVQTRERGIPA